VNNFRGVTLLSIIGELFTKIINTRLTKWAEDYFIYVGAQAGFKSKMSTIYNTFALNTIISHCLNNNEHTFCLFVHVDYSKTFDYIV